MKPDQWTLREVWSWDYGPEERQQKIYLLIVGMVLLSLVKKEVQIRVVKKGLSLERIQLSVPPRVPFRRRQKSLFIVLSSVRGRQKSLFIVLLKCSFRLYGLNRALQSVLVKFLICRYMRIDINFLYFEYLILYDTWILNRNNLNWENWWVFCVYYSRGNMSTPKLYVSTSLWTGSSGTIIHHLGHWGIRY